jgi:hypothetical protein
MSLGMTWFRSTFSLISLILHIDKTERHTLVHGFILSYEKYIRHSALYRQHLWVDAQTSQFRRY